MVHDIIFYILQPNKQNMKGMFLSASVVYHGFNDRRGKFSLECIIHVSEVNANPNPSIDLGTEKMFAKQLRFVLSIINPISFDLCTYFSIFFLKSRWGHHHTHVFHGNDALWSVNFEYRNANEPVLNPSCQMRGNRRAPQIVSVKTTDKKLEDNDILGGDCFWFLYNLKFWLTNKF